MLEDIHEHVILDILTVNTGAFVHYGDANRSACDAAEVSHTVTLPGVCDHHWRRSVDVELSCRLQHTPIVLIDGVRLVPGLYLYSMETFRQVISHIVHVIILCHIRDESVGCVTFLSPADEPHASMIDREQFIVNVESYTICINSTWIDDCEVHRLLKLINVSDVSGPISVLAHVLF